MNVLSIIFLLIFVCIGLYAIYNDFKMAKRIMLFDGKDLSLKKDLQTIIDKKTKLCYTKEDLEVLKMPFDYTEKKFII